MLSKKPGKRGQKGRDGRRDGKGLVCLTSLFSRLRNLGVIFKVRFSGDADIPFRCALSIAGKLMRLFLRKQVALFHPALWNHLMRSFHPGGNWRAHAAQQPPNGGAVWEWRAVKVSKPHPPSAQHNQISDETASAPVLVSCEDRVMCLPVGNQQVKQRASQSQGESDEPSFPLPSALWQIKN